MRTSKSTRKGAGRLISLFHQQHQDFRALELALEEGDLAAARRALAQCLQNSRDTPKTTETVNAPAGSPPDSPPGPMADLFLKADLSLLAEALRTGELPPRLAPHAAPRPCGRANDEAEFIRDLFDALRASEAASSAESAASHSNVHKLFKDK